MTNTEKAQSLAGFSNPIGSRFLRPAPAAKYVSLSRATLYSLMSSGKLKTHLVGGARLIDREELDRFVLSHAS